MLLNNQPIKFRILNQWFNQPQGIRAAQAFTAEIRQASDLLSGQRLLQLGYCGNNLWLPDFKFQEKWIVTPNHLMYDHTITALLSALPFAQNSMDCIIAPLTLEAFHDINLPLDEIDRVLRPMGYVIFWGINPWSLWGASLKLGYTGCFGDHKTYLTSSFSLKRALLQRDYQQCLHTSFYYIPPIHNQSLIRKLAFFNEMGKMLWPFPAGFYCIIMQKYQNNLLLSDELYLKPSTVSQKLALPLTG